MTNQMQVFNNNEFGQVRTEVINGKPYFCGKDIAECLGYARPRKAISDHCLEHGVLKRSIGVQTGLKANGEPAIQQVQMKFISEGNVYRLITHSKLPTAERFEAWVFDEVLPCIRQTGYYSTALGLPNFDDPVASARAWADEREKVLIAQRKLSIVQPKADYLDLIMANNCGVNVTTIAKDYGMSARAFNNILHSYRIQYKNGNMWVLYANYDDQGYTVSRTTLDNEKSNVYIQTLWTQKGRLFLYNFLKAHGILPLIEQANSIIQ